MAPSRAPRLVAELLPLRRGAHHGEAVGRRQKVPHFAGRGGCGLVEAMGKPWENQGKTRRKPWIQLKFGCFGNVELSFGFFLELFWKYWPSSSVYGHGFSAWGRTLEMSRCRPRWCNRFMARRRSMIFQVIDLLKIYGDFSLFIFLGYLDILMFLWLFSWISMYLIST